MHNSRSFHFYLIMGSWIWKPVYLTANTDVWKGGAGGVHAGEE